MEFEADFMFPIKNTGRPQSKTPVDRKILACCEEENGCPGTNNTVDSQSTPTFRNQKHPRHSLKNNARGQKKRNFAIKILIFEGFSMFFDWFLALVSGVFLL